MSALRGWPAIRTVARREIRERGRDRSTLISTLVTLVILAGVVVLPTLVGAGDDPKVKVLVVGDTATAVAAAAHDGQEPFGVRISARPAASDAAAARAVADGDADVAIVGDGARLVVADDADDGGVAAIQAASQRTRAAAALDRNGIAGADAARILAPPPLPTSSVGEEDSRGLAFIVLLVLYGQLLTYGIVVATGIVEEKQSRIVELVLSAIRPRDLLAGKVLGIGVVAFAQLLAIGAAGIGLAAATGSLDVGGSGVPGALAITLAWFVLGYALFACAYAAGGALVSRQEELQSATTPITMVVLGAFLVSLGALNDPSSTLAKVLSFVPPCTPLVLPIRQIAGEASAADVVIGVLVMLASIALLVAFAGRVYANVVLRTGSRVSLRTALRQDA
ncbi:ABC transporter permease [Baekduia sp. Peel2402]|uniref:ABC transporter permease n=1 Tax=Baekduia sp. Peel2402 TaxID=3458296 RepID=UPI00403E6F12